MCQRASRFLSLALFHSVGNDLVEAPLRAPTRQRGESGAVRDPADDVLEVSVEGALAGEEIGILTLEPRRVGGNATLAVLRAGSNQTTYRAARHGARARDVEAPPRDGYLE